MNKGNIVIPVILTVLALGIATTVVVVKRDQFPLSFVSKSKTPKSTLANPSAEDIKIAKQATLSHDAATREQIMTFYFQPNLIRYHVAHGYFPFGTGTCNGTFSIEDLFRDKLFPGQKDPQTMQLLIDGPRAPIITLNGVSVCGLTGGGKAKYYYSGGNDGKTYILRLIHENGEIKDYLPPT